MDTASEALALSISEKARVDMNYMAQLSGKSQEELIDELKDEYTIAIVTHNMQQALRISDSTAFFLLGDLVEYDNTEKLFSVPSDKRTEDYITGRFG